MSQLGRRPHERPRAPPAGARPEIAYPATPSFDLRFDRRRAGVGRLRPLALGFAILLAVLAGVLALSPGARSAFLEIFRIRGATVERVETLPDVEAQRVDFGERVSREEAERRAGFQLLDLGSEPDAIFVRPDGLASVVYGDPAQPTARALAGARRDLRGFIKKTGSRGHDVEEVTVVGEPRPLRRRRRPLRHVPGRERLRSPTRPRTSPARCCSGTEGPLLLRLEGDMTRGEALALAKSVE